jgi:Protein of unknown function (DUF1501)
MLKLKNSGHENTPKDGNRLPEKPDRKDTDSHRCLRTRPTSECIQHAGGGIKAGVTVGETDDLGIGAVRDRVHVHDLHATILQLLGFDHERLTYRFQGRDFRLTDVHGLVQQKLLA